jgi:hypothetical protein
MRFRLSIVLPAAVAVLTAVLAVDLLRAQTPPPTEPLRPAAAAAKDDAKSQTDPAEEAAKAAIDQKLLAEAKDHSEIMKNLTYLSDVIGPRLTGSPALERANKWTAEKMKEYGLENVHLEPWTIPVGWERGTASIKIIDPDNGKSLTVASYAWAPGTKGPVEGEVVIFRPTSKDDLAKYKGKLKNAIVLSSPPAFVAPISEMAYGGGRRGGRGGDDKAGEKAGDKAAEKAGDKAGEKGGRGNFGRGNFNRPYAQSREASEFLKAEGAAVTLIDSQKPHGLLNMTGSWRSGFGPEREGDRAEQPEPMPRLFITHDHYALLWRLANRPDAKTRAVVEISNKFVPGPITCYNTVGEVRGTEKPDEYVVCGAHLDSWDLGQGTTDNGTGSCVVLETARVIAKAAQNGTRPKRTIRFILFTGEEEGLVGSRHYVTYHKEEMAKTSMAIVHDTGTGKVRSINTSGVEDIKTIFEKELLPSLKALGVEITMRGGFGGGGSDHASFGGVGVAGILFNQDVDEYRFTHHSQSDTLDKAKEPNLIQGAQVMSVAAMRVANLPSLLPRTPIPQRRFGGQ